MSSRTNISGLHEIIAKRFQQCIKKGHAHKGDYEYLVNDIIEAVKKKIENSIDKDAQTEHCPDCIKYLLEELDKLKGL